MTLRNSARGAARDCLGTWRENPSHAAATTAGAALILLAAALAVAYAIRMYALLQAL